MNSASCVPMSRPDPPRDTPRDRSHPGVGAALAALLDLHLSSVGVLRALVNASLAAGYAWAFHSGERTVDRGELAARLVLAGIAGVVILAQARRWPRSATLAAGVAVDVASLAVAGLWALRMVGRVADAGGLALAVVQIAFLAGVLVLSIAPAFLRPALDALAAELVRATEDPVGARAVEAHRRRERGVPLAELVVHDLRNPLSAILANVEYARLVTERRPDGEEEREALRLAASAAIRMSGMIGDLLVLPRLERGELTARRDSTRVRDLLESVATGMLAQARAGEVAVRVVAPPDLVAWIDGELVRRLVENLASNALRHAPRLGCIELVAAPEQGRLLVAVRNDGPPVASDVRPRLFERYGGCPREGYVSNGLGLYLCRLVAEAHGGRIALRDRPGWGVSFEAELPLAGRS
jgi:signal transduction histidine kinase